MFAGNIVEFGPANTVLHRPSHPYTQELMSSLITDSTRLDLASDRGLSGAKSLVLVQSVGCKYASRCKYAMEVCRREAPVAKEIEDELWVACHKYK